MAETTASSTRTLTVPVSRRGQQFEFRLHARPLDLGRGIRVLYYWLDTSLFRRFKADSSFAAFRDVLGHWATTMRAAGAWDIDDEVHYVAAQCYPLVAEAKSLQDVYKDAYLKPRSTNPTADSLSDDARKRVRRVVRERDAGLVRAELDHVLGRFEPPAHMMPFLQEAFRRWVGCGVVELRRSGNDGLVRFFREVDEWIARYRKKGGNPWVRHFVNLFAYECKVSFYTCYANAWVDLIPWLKEHRGLDAVSERFLRFWHHQNASTGGAEGRDAFNGQVLALHPLSGFFMKDPALLAVAGRFFGTAAHDRALAQGKAGSSKAYWDLVGAIVTAAHLYRNALDRQERGRGTRAAVSLDALAPQVAGEGGDDLGPLRDFLSARGVKCPHCRARVELRSAESVSAEADTFDAYLTCRACRRTVTHPVATDDLLDWLRAE